MFDIGESELGELRELREKDALCELGTQAILTWIIHEEMRFSVGAAALKELGDVARFSFGDAVRTPSSLSTQFKENKDDEYHCLLGQGEPG